MAPPDKTHIKEKHGNKSQRMTVCNHEQINAAGR